MSPTKRTLSVRYGGEFNPKRIRGGGGDSEFVAEVRVDDDELFEYDLVGPTSEEQFVPDEVLEQAAKGIPEGAQQRWKRPQLPSEFSYSNDLNIQWIDIDVVTGKVLEKNPNSKKKLVGSPEGPVPVLRCFGVDEYGHSVSMFIHGFIPYAFFALPANAILDESVDERQALHQIAAILNTRLQSMARGVSQTTPAVWGIQYIRDHKSIFGYDTPHTKFFKVHVALPNMVPPLKRIMEEGIQLPFITIQNDNTGMLPIFTPFECNVPFVLRFMVDRDITGAGWLLLSADTYTVRNAALKETHCQVRSIIYAISSVVYYRSQFLANHLLQKD